MAATTIDMYETHFGLKKRPFRALALGNDVFVGPQTAATMSGIKKALATADAIAAVSGPVGGGKTTVVGRALEGLGSDRITIPVGRIKLGHDEVLELLLEELGVEKLPAGTVQRFSLFRRMLKELADKNSRVVIVVEDAVRIGADSLAELEALTAADAGMSEGANVVLMGNEDIDALLESPGLARLKQRLRLRQALAPFSAKELLAYFKHCFRLAGGDFDSLFAAGAADLIHQLSGGIPRMASNIAESAMAVAAEEGLKQVAATHISKVASEEYGMTVAVSTEPAMNDHEASAEPQKPAAEPVAEQPIEIEPQPEEEAPPAEPEPVATPEDQPADDIPELIQDTLPDLEVLAPELAKAPAASPTEPALPTLNIPTAASEEPAPVETPKPETRESDMPEPEPPVIEPMAEDDIPTLSATQPAIEPEEVPAWERDPTLAELRPDLDALEHAMAVAQGLDTDSEEEDVEEAPAADSDAPPEKVPEITLDRQIQAKIEEAAEAIKRTEEAAAAKAEADAEAEKSIDIAQTGEIAVELPPIKKPEPAAEESEQAATAPEAPAEPAAAPEAPSEPAAAPEALPEAAAAAPSPPEADDQQAAAANDTGGNTEELQKIAANLSRAKTLDDVDDMMAETLFGDEFSEIAAQVAAKASEGLPANDELELVEDEPAAQAAPVADFDGAAAVSVPPAPEAAGTKPQLDEAAEQRLATVRALNGAPNVTPPPPPSAESIVMTDTTMTSQPPANGEQPESIENQINTSITQTLKALNVRAPVDDEDEQEKKGFFSRFRKS